MALTDEVEEQRRLVHTDGYPMSIGELTYMYRDGELDIHPEFQRLFRWSPGQKSRLIESLLLGIPMPSIFVSQHEDGVWEVVDGLQRLSTIFEVMGILKNESGELCSQLPLKGTKYLPSLEGKRWGTDEEDPDSIGWVHQRIVKRAKFDVKILLRRSDEETKFELFQRLNIAGSPLSSQELRNYLIIMVSPEKYGWLRQLAENENFRHCLAFSDQAHEKQYNVELAVRFLVFRCIEAAKAGKIGDLQPFLDDEIAAKLRSPDFNLEHEERVFRNTFDVLACSLGDEAFRKYNSKQNKFIGGFLVSAFEAIALGLGYCFENEDYRPPRDIDQIAKSLWTPEFISKTGSGTNVHSRLEFTISSGRKLFAP